MKTIHPTTEALLGRFRQSKVHALLLKGPSGTDFIAAVELLKRSLGATTLPIDSSSYSSAKEVRELYELTRTVPNHPVIVYLASADEMSPAAQNALLKLLEEPPQNYLFLLSSSRPDRLLPTVRSRMQSINMLPITTEQSDAVLDELGVSDATLRRQLLFIAGGLPVELQQLVNDKEYFDKKVAIMRDAKALLQAKTYDKIVIANNYKDSRDASITLLEYTINLVVQTLEQKPSPTLLKTLARLTSALQSISQNGNVRLALLSVMV